MNAHDDAHLREILDQAAELPPKQRGAFLDGACAGDPELRAEVEFLPSSLERAEGDRIDASRFVEVYRADTSFSPASPRAGKTKDGSRASACRASWHDHSRVPPAPRGGRLGD